MSPKHQEIRLELLVWRTDSGGSPWTHLGFMPLWGPTLRARARPGTCFPSTEHSEDGRVCVVLGMRFHDHTYEMVPATRERDLSLAGLAEASSPLGRPEWPRAEGNLSQQPERNFVLSPVSRKELNSSNKRKFGCRPFPSHIWDEAVAPSRHLDGGL